MIVKDLKPLLEIFKNHNIKYLLPNSELVPSHFHVTEIGEVNKKFIDCGGTYREQSSCLLQLWVANDEDHRLNAEKLLKIFNLTDKLNIEDLSIEVEYGEEVASQYSLVNVHVDSDNLTFQLQGKKTDCLAKDKCGVSCCGRNC